MKCPKCKEKIDCVFVYSQCVQTGFLKGNEIISYSGVDEIFETQQIQCPHCLANITEDVEE